MADGTRLPILVPVVANRDKSGGCALLSEVALRKVGAGGTAIPARYWVARRLEASSERQRFSKPPLRVVPTCS
jgi:hypothetical protein